VRWCEERTTPQDVQSVSPVGMSVWMVGEWQWGQVRVGCWWREGGILYCI
jgi:hypothetical protein